MDTTEIEKCHYCNRKAEYNDLASEKDHFVVAGVCPKHVKNYAEGS